MKRPNVVIIDYGMGNLLSVARALEYCGADVTITNNHKLLCAASHVVLPGVGAFPRAMEALHHYELVDLIHIIAQRGIPFLGICLGMQLLLSESEEFSLTAGLDLIAGRVIPIPKLSLDGLTQRIPHIGWSTLHSPQGDKLSSEIMLKNKIGQAVYFIHSYMAQLTHVNYCVAECIYGERTIPAIIEKNNVIGCQFHPEKSGVIGLGILC